MSPTLLSVLITSDSTVLALARETQAVISIVELFLDLGDPPRVLMAPLTVLSPGPRLAGTPSSGTEVLKSYIRVCGISKKIVNLRSGDLAGCVVLSRLQALG